MTVPSSEAVAEQQPVGAGGGGEDVTGDRYGCAVAPHLLHRCGRGHVEQSHQAGAIPAGQHVLQGVVLHTGGLVPLAGELYHLIARGGPPHTHGAVR
eukprot:CAMPEP_0173212574 /NCGR_PEP_ID=MMETSP1141-20130122/24885_1 /TAXON_ID=483371 /ORGANISM="non described non described, Strain CCMP2298" /LENGTH=96 /DNA_ID=CAMNT_0014139627 /DNA_START=6 /DNA_END=292 /DNA_ORIENTATION=-